MANIFGRTSQALGGVFLADYGKISFGAAVSAALVQNVNFTFRQTVNRLYELGNTNVGDRTNVYYVGGRMEGNLTIGRVIGPAHDVADFYCLFGCVCEADENNLTLDLGQGDCLGGPCGAPPVAGDLLSYTLEQCVITQVGVTVAAQDMLINENVQLMFNNVTVTPASAFCP